MDNIYVTEETLVGDVVRLYPECIDILFGLGMHCLGCPASQAESLADACAVHGMDPQQVVKSMNEKIAKTRGQEA